jgi:hypothetical protein
MRGGCDVEYGAMNLLLAILAADGRTAAETEETRGGGRVGATEGTVTAGDGGEGDETEGGVAVGALERRPR